MYVNYMKINKIKQCKKEGGREINTCLIKRPNLHKWEDDDFLALVKMKAV